MLKSPASHPRAQALQSDGRIVSVTPSRVLSGESDGRLPSPAIVRDLHARRLAVLGFLNPEVFSVQTGKGAVELRPCRRVDPFRGLESDLDGLDRQQGSVGEVVRPRELG